MGGGSKGKTGASKKLEKIGSAFFKESTPARQELLSQMEEALTTGGVGARMPIISKAEEASKQATSRSLRALEGQLAQTGQAGTPFGTRALGEMSQRGEQATAAIGPQMAAQFLAQIAPLVFGQASQGIQGLSGAVEGQAGQAGAEAQWLKAMTSMFTPGFMEPIKWG
jgi:hypothetical protein